MTAFTDMCFILMMALLNRLKNIKVSYICIFVIPSVRKFLHSYYFSLEELQNALNAFSCLFLAYYSAPGKGKKRGKKKKACLVISVSG